MRLNIRGFLGLVLRGIALFAVISFAELPNLNLAYAAPKLKGTVTLQKSGQGSLSLSVKGVSASTKLLSAGTQLTVGIDDYRFSLALRSRKKNKANDNTLLTTSKKNSALGNISTLLNTKGKSLSFVAKNTVLAGLNNPLQISVDLGSKKICQTMRLKSISKNSKTNFVLAPLGLAGCAISDTPRISPGAVTVGEQSQLQARITLPNSLPPGPVQLYSMKADGTPGAALCQMVDDGSPAAQDLLPGDRTFSCIFNLPTDTVRTFTMAAGVGRGRRQTFSSGIEFSVVRAINDADIDEVVKVSSVARATFDTAYRKFGDTIEMRLEIIKALSKRPEIESVGLSSNQQDIWIIYRSGVEGILGLTPQPDGTVGPLVQKDSAAQASLTSVTASGQEVGMSLAYDSLRLPQANSQSVLIYDPGYFGEEYDETYLINKLMTEMATPPFTVSAYRGAAAGIETLKNLSGFGTLIFVTHGAVSHANELLIQTANTLDKKLKEQYKAFLKVDSFGSHFLVPASFIAENNTFGGELVYAGFCYSALKSDFSDAFLGKGAATFFGYTRAVPTSFAQRSATQLFCAMLLQGDDSTTAFNAVTPKKPDPNMPLEFVSRGTQSVTYPVSKITNIPIELTSDIDDPIVLLKGQYVTFGLKTGDRDLISCVKTALSTAKDGLGQITDTSLNPLKLNEPLTLKPMAFSYTATSEKPGSDEVRVKVVTLNEKDEIKTVSRKIEVGCKRLDSFELKTSKATVKPKEDFTVTTELTGESKEKECELEFEWKLAYEKNGAFNPAGPFCHKWATTQPGLTARSAVINSNNCAANNPKGKPGVIVTVNTKWGSNPVKRKEAGYSTASVGIECLKCKGGQGLRLPSDLCTPVEGCCSDNEDNDFDGKVDCDDDDCAGDEQCPTCADIDVSSMQSVCGTISNLPATVQPGDTVTISSFYYCNNGVGGEVGLSYATPNVIVDGVPVTATAGAPYIYDYRVWPTAMVKVPVLGGTHSLTFTIRDDAPMACVQDQNGYFVGPWAILGAGGWSSPRTFKIGS